MHKLVCAPLLSHSLIHFPSPPLRRRSSGPPPSPRYPLLRVINTWDLVPAFPAVKNGFALNQGGIVLPLPNYYTQGCEETAAKTSFTSQDPVPKSGVFPRTAPEAAERAMCAGEVRARSPCHSPRCEKTHKAIQDEFGKSMSTHHDAILQVEPPMFMFMEAVRARETKSGVAGAAVPACKQDENKHQMHTFMTSGLPEGKDGDIVFAAWKAHVMNECDRKTWSEAKEKARGFKHNHHCDFVRAEHGFSTCSGGACRSRSRTAGSLPKDEPLPKGVCDDGFSDKDKYKMNDKGNIVLKTARESSSSAHSTRWSLWGARAMTDGQAQLSASPTGRPGGRAISDVPPPSAPAAAVAAAVEAKRKLKRDAGGATRATSFLQTAKTQQACPTGSKHQFRCEDGACVISEADCKTMTALASGIVPVATTMPVPNKAGPMIDSVQKGLRAV